MTVLEILSNNTFNKNQRHEFNKTTKDERRDETRDKRPRVLCTILYNFTNVTVVHRNPKSRYSEYVL